MKLSSKTLTSIFFLLLTALLFFPPAIHASPAPPPFTFAKPSVFSITSVGYFIQQVVKLLVMVAGLLLFIYLVWGGIDWMTSGGDKGKLQAARDKISAALIGLSIIALSIAVSYILEAFFGIKIIALQVIPKGF